MLNSNFLYNQTTIYHLHEHTMNKITQFEDLSNDLFLEIFDYLHALDLFTTFSSLNNRISSILFLTRLHVVVSKLHCQHQIKILSSHLTHHAHQVVSLSLHDQLRDFTSVISFIFNQHTFKNLQSCKFYSIHPSSKLDNVIQKLENLDKLVIFRLIQPKDIPMPDAIKRDLSKTILMHRSPVLCSVNLKFRYNYPNLVCNIAVNSTVTSLYMTFYGSATICLIYRILPILRNYRALRVLRISILNDNKSNTQQTM